MATVLTQMDSADEAVRARRGWRAAVTAVVIGAPFVITCICVADWIFAAVRPATRDQVWLWYTVTHFNGLPNVQASFFLLAAATVLLAARGVGSLWCEIALVAEFAVYCFGLKVWPPTGDQMTWYQNAATSNVSLSEPLADVLHKIPYWATGDLETVRLVSPVFGVVTLVIGIALVRRLSRLFDVPRWVLLGGLVASPLPFWYVTGYVENTFLAVPFVMLGIWFACGAALGSARERAEVIGSACMFTVAGLFHAGFMLLAVGLGAWILLRGERAMGARVRDAGAALGAAAATAAIIVGVVALLPVRLAPGNSQGGYDSQLLVPFSPRVGDPMFRFVFASHAHLIEVSNIVVHAAPGLVLALPVLLVVAWSQGRLRRSIIGGPTGESLMLLLCTTSLVYLLFASTWGFDLGPVGDLDLMLTMDIGFVLAVVVLVGRLLRGRPVLLGALLLISGAIQCAFYAMKIADVWVR